MSTRFAGRPSFRLSHVAAFALAAACALAPEIVAAQSFELIGGNVQKRANGVLALMGFQLTPDVNAGSLSISNGATDNPSFNQTSFGGGFTMSREFPLYLEGTAGYSRYDPTFVATNGQEERQIPVKWNSLSATGGVGWDFEVADELWLRPIVNFSLGRVASDSAIAGRLLQEKTGIESDLTFLDNGRLNAYGLGGSLMLAYYRHRPESEYDVELRYSNIGLRSFDSSPGVQGYADAQSVNLWARRRAPTGFFMLNRPVRYVLEYTHAEYLGDLQGVLGFNHLNTFGTGLELDTSAHDIIITRARLVARYTIGTDVQGWSIGFAVSF